jgi:hypothetical protein
MVAVVGVGSGAALTGLLHHVVATQYVEERVPARHPPCAEHLTKHQPEFYAPYACVLLTDFTHCIHYTEFPLQTVLHVCIFLVKGLSAMAKQITGS